MAFFLSIYGTHGVKLFSIVKFDTINNDIIVLICIESLLMIPYKNRLLFIVSFIFSYSAFMYSSSEINASQAREDFLDNQVLENPYLDQGFNLLHKRDLLTIDMPNSLKSPLYNYFDTHVAGDVDDAEANFGDVHGQALDLVVQTMKNPYLQDFEKYIQDPALVADTSIIEYVMNQDNKVIVPMVLKDYINTPLNDKIRRCGDGSIQYSSSLSDYLLHRAIEKNDQGIAEKLIEVGANVNIENIDKKRPLILAVCHNNIKIAQKLLAFGAYVLEQGDLQRNALHEIQSVEMVQVFVEHEKSLKPKLKQSNFSIRWIRDISGDMPLYRVVKKGDIKLVKAFLDAGALPGGHLQANINIWDSINKNIPMVRLLLQHGFNKNLKYKNGETLFFKACKDRDLAMMALLTSVGVEYTQQAKQRDDKAFTSPLDYAIENDYKDVVTELLHNKIYNINSSVALLKAVSAKKLPIITMSLELGADVNYKDASGKSALYYAVRDNYIEAVEILLNTPEINLACTYENDQTILLLAVTNNSTEIVEKLIAARVNIDIQDEKGMTSLHLAVKNNSSYLVNILLKAGASFDIENNEGLLPRELARDLRIKNMISNEQRRRDMLNR